MHIGVCICLGRFHQFTLNCYSSSQTLRKFLKKRLRKEWFPSNRSWNNKTRSYGNQFLRCSIERFWNDCRKTKTKTKAITPTNHNRGRQRDEPILSQFVAIICNSLKEREKSRVHGAIGFGFNSHWLKNWRESFTGLLTGCAGAESHNNAQSEEIRKIPHNTEIFTWNFN